MSEPCPSFVSTQKRRWSPVRKHTVRDYLDEGLLEKAKAILASCNAGVWESDIFPAIGTVRFEHCAYKGFPPAIVTSLCPCYVPSMWSMDLHALVYQDGFGTPMTGIGICKDPCSYLHDAKFEHSVEQWEEWRRFASKKHGGDWRDAA